MDQPEKKKPIRKRSSARSISLPKPVDDKLEQLVELSQLNASAVITILIQRANPDDFAGYAPRRLVARNGQEGGD